MDAINGAIGGAVLVTAIVGIGYTIIRIREILSI